MKKRVLGFFVVTMMLLTSLSRVPAAPEGVKDRIVKATNTLVGPPDATVTQEKIVGALLELLDVAATITPDNKYREEIRYRIQVAKDLIKKDSLFNDKARQYLSFAYRMMTDGKKYAKPKELDEFIAAAELQEKSLRYMRNLVAKAIESLGAGNEGETAKLLLEPVLMTITPVTG